SELTRVSIGPIQTLTGKILDTDDAQRILWVEDKFGNVAMGANLQAASRLSLTDALARTGSMSILIDCHRNGDEPSAMALKNTKIVRVKFRSEVIRAKEKGQVPEMNR